MERNEWKLIKFDYQLACTNLGAIACENFIYLVGLKNEKNSSRTICLKYEPIANKFIRLANLNNGRSQSALIWQQSGPTDFYLFVFGGYDQYRCLNTCEFYNIREDKWSLIPSMHEARRGCGAAYHERTQSVYIVGGTNGSQSLRSMEIYDVKARKWRIGPELNMARTNVAIAFVGELYQYIIYLWVIQHIFFSNCIHYLGDILFATGGFDGKSFLKTIEYLNVGAPNEGWSLYFKPVDFEFLIYDELHAITN